jgi:uncharacterized membrane protein
VATSNLFQAWVKHARHARRSTSLLAETLFWWVIPFAAAALGFTLLLKATVIAATWGHGFPMKILHANKDVPGFFAVHILAGAVALLIGPWQFSAFLRGMYPRLHRVLGRSYVGFVLLSAAASLFLTPRLDVLGTGYMRIVTAVLWSAFTVLAVLAIRNRNITAHRRWMLRSYAFTFMGLTLLFYNWVGATLDLALAYKYPAVAWLTFLTNVLFIEIMLWRSPRRTSARVHVRMHHSGQLVDDGQVTPSSA